MERDDAAAGGQECEQRRQIAVYDERLRGGAEFVAVEERQQLRTAVAAADADHAGDRSIGPGLAQRGRADAGIAGDVPAAGEDAVVVHRLEPERSDLVDAAIEFITIER